MKEKLIEYYNDGKFKIIGTYFDKKLHGTYEEYYQNGLLKEKGEYKYGNKTGSYLYYHDNGNLHKSITYESHDGKELKRGPYKIFDKDGTLIREGTHDSIGDRYKEYYSNGNVKLEVEYIASDSIIMTSYYEDGKLHKIDTMEGECVEYYDNGQLKEKKNYYSHILDGPYESYFKNGQLKEKATYKLYDNQASVYHGDYELYYENGQIRAKGMFKNGRKFGLFEKFHENGQLRERGNYIFKDWASIGNLKLYYEDADLKYHNHLDEAKYKVPDVLHGIFESYYDNGILKERANYRRGKKDGTYLSYNENGKLLKKDIYKNGKPIRS